MPPDYYLQIRLILKHRCYLHQGTIISWLYVVFSQVNVNHTQPPVHPQVGHFIMDQGIAFILCEIALIWNNSHTIVIYTKARVGEWLFIHVIRYAILVAVKSYPAYIY